MQIQIEHDSEVTRLAAVAGCSVEQYVNRLIKQAADLEAIHAGLDDVKMGRTSPLKDFDRAFRKEMGFVARAET